MKAKEITVDSLGGSQKHILIEHDDGSFTSFPADLNNQNYVALMALVAEGQLTIAPAEGDK